MSCIFAHPVEYGCCVAPASDGSPAMFTDMRRACTVRTPMLRPDKDQPCCRTAADSVFRPHSNVQGVRCQRAAFAAPARPCRLRCAPRARLAHGQYGSRSRERMLGTEALGQIKGVARRAPQSQSARGFVAAPRGVSRVPCRHGNSHACGVCRVPFAMACATMRLGFRHGQP